PPSRTPVQQARLPRVAPDVGFRLLLADAAAGAAGEVLARATGMVDVMADLIDLALGEGSLEESNHLAIFAGWRAAPPAGIPAMARAGCRIRPLSWEELLA